MAVITPLGQDPGFDNTPIPNYTPGPTPLSTDPYSLTIMASIAPGTTKEETDLADAVIQATVAQISLPRWSTPDGQRPANPHSDNNLDYILTPVSVQMNSTLKGDALQTQYLLLAIGGTVGQDSVLWAADDTQMFQQGQNVVLYLNRAQSRDRIQTLNGQTLWKVGYRYTVVTTNSGLMATNSYRSSPLNGLLSEIHQATGR